MKCTICDMEEGEEHDRIVGMAIVVLLLLIIGSFFIFSDYERTPEPNQEKLIEATTYFNTSVCCAGSWKNLCDKYQAETNQTFNCFE